MAIDTPCTKICTLDPRSGLCLGCGRTTHEIAQWLSYSDQERRTIMTQLPMRLHGLRASGNRTEA